jgi:hypothetical protein
MLGMADVWMMQVYGMLLEQLPSLLSSLSLFLVSLVCDGEAIDVLMLPKFLFLADLELDTLLCFDDSLEEPMSSHADRLHRMFGVDILDVVLGLSSFWASDVVIV